MLASIALIANFRVKQDLIKKIMAIQKNDLQLVTTIGESQEEC